MVVFLCLSAVDITGNSAATQRAAEETAESLFRCKIKQKAADKPLLTGLFCQVVEQVLF
jgi:hypothetical protein